MGLTQRRFVANSIAQKIPGAHCGQLRETFHEPLGLCPFANARRTDKNNTSSAFELFSGHSEEVRYVGMRSGELRSALNGRIRVGRSCSWEREKLEASRLYILQPHIELVKGMYICTRIGVDTQCNGVDIEDSKMGSAGRPKHFGPSP